MMAFSLLRRTALMLVLAGALVCRAQGLGLGGKVVDQTGAGIAGASVSLSVAGVSTLTDAQGNFTLEPSAISPSGRAAAQGPAIPAMHGARLRFHVDGTGRDVRIAAYDYMGRMIHRAIDKWLTPGSYTIDPLSGIAVTRPYLLKVDIGNQTSVLRLAAEWGASARAIAMRPGGEGAGALAKSAAVVDTLVAAKQGFLSARKAIDAYTGTHTLTLQPATLTLLYPRHGTRLFKSPGGAIVFEWSAAAGAQSYNISVDGAVLRTGIPGAVTHCAFPISQLGAVMYGTHSWSVSAITAAGALPGDDAVFTLSRAVDGTTGMPMGGIGAGVIKFSPWRGEFAFQPKAPPGVNFIGQTQDWQFQLYTNRSGNTQTVAQMRAAQSGGRYDDDAAFPMQQANFGSTNDVSVTMTAFAPWNLDSVRLMTYPYGFFQFTVRNNLPTRATVAIALQINFESTPAYIAGKGLSGGGGIERAVYAAGSDPQTTVSCGADNGFLSSGQLSNTPGWGTNKVAVKLDLDGGEKQEIKFVVSWYMANNKSWYYYTNFVNNAAQVADIGLSEFNDMRDRAVGYVDRFRGSDLPDWFLNLVVNNIQWTNNCAYLRDGRCLQTEGIYGWMGQMDQGWHAFTERIMHIPEVTFLWDNASELEYWARTMMVGGETDGQISHDFNAAGGGICGWDDPGYHGWGGPNWADNNCGFIFTMYESFITTGNKQRMDQLWPYMLRTGERLYRMATGAYKNDFAPMTFSATESTYDKGPMDDNLYNSGMAVTAFDIMSRMAAIYGDTATASKFGNASATARQSFQRRFLDRLTFDAKQEVALTGQWMSFYFKLGQQYPDSILERAMTHQTDGYFHPLEQGMAAAGNNGEDEGWAPYLASHLAGPFLYTNRRNEWRAIHRDLHDRMIDNRNRVFNSSLYVVSMPRGGNYQADTWSGYDQYCSMPVVWRSYQSLVGYQYNAYTRELWIEPNLVNVADKWGESMNHEITDAFISTPGTYGKLSYKEGGSGYADKDITVTFDRPVEVRAIYLRDNYAGGVRVTVDGAPQSEVERIGTYGYDREVKIKWTGTVGPRGIRIRATNS